MKNNNESSKDKQNRLSCIMTIGTDNWDCYKDCACWDGRICTDYEEDEVFYKISDIVKFPYGTKFENIETGTTYVMEQQLKIIKSNGDYDYPALDKESFEEEYRIIN